MSTLLTCALVFNLSTPIIPQGSVPDAFGFKQVELSKNVSQLLRSNADHIWSYNRDPRVLGDLVNYTDPSGTISGDPHLGNMTVIPVQTKRGQSTMKFLNVDFDDGGRGPFALEFARFVLVAKASSKDIRTKDLFKAYLKGLRGEEINMPRSIAKAVSMDMQAYETQRAAYVAKKMKDGHFKYKAGEIEKWEGRPNKSDVKKLFKGSQVIEVAKRPLERGGSLDAGERLWVLTLDKDGSYHITELKPYVETALQEYTRQADADTRVENLHEVYWPELDPSAYDLVEVARNRYWVREKKVEVLSYKNRAEEDEARFYIANIIGLTQGSQAEGPKLLRMIEKDPERFKEAVKKYVKDYLGLANSSMD
jgi:hypothetical protein